MSEKENPITEFIEKNVFVSLLFITITTVGATYLVIDKVILSYYRLEIERLEQVISENDESTITYEKRIKSKDDKIDSLQVKLKQASKNTIATPPDNRGKELATLINQGRKLSKKDLAKDSTSIEFENWRRKCIALIASLNESESDIQNFEAKTNLSNENYPKIPTMINDGIEILEKLKGKL